MPHSITRLSSYSITRFIPLPASIAPIFAPIPAVFAAVEAIFDPIADAAVVTRVANVLASIPDVLAPIAAVFAAVGPVLDPIAPLPARHAGFCSDRRGDRQGEQHQYCTLMHRSGSMSAAGRQPRPSLTSIRPAVAGEG